MQGLGDNLAAVWRGPSRNENENEKEKVYWTDELGDCGCWRRFYGRSESAAGRPADAGAKRSASANGKRACVRSHYRTESDGSDAGRRAIGDGYLPAEECQRARADYLGA